MERLCERSESLVKKREKEKKKGKRRRDSVGCGAFVGVCLGWCCVRVALRSVGSLNGAFGRSVRSLNGAFGVVFEWFRSGGVGLGVVFASGASGWWVVSEELVRLSERSESGVVCGDLASEASSEWGDE